MEIEGGLTSAPDSISELFARDPMEWDEAAMTRMISYYRELRVKLKQEEAKPKKTAAAKIPKEDLKDISADDLLGKLGLDL